MKLKNDLKTGISIGAGLIVLTIFLTGSTIDNNSVNEKGTYQISTTARGEKNWVYETIIDTRTGEVVSRERLSSANDYPEN